jgi:hypothetical protein
VLKKLYPVGSKEFEHATRVAKDKQDTKYWQAILNRSPLGGQPRFDSIPYEYRRTLIEEELKNTVPALEQLNRAQDLAIKEYYAGRNINDTGFTFSDFSDRDKQNVSVLQKQIESGGVVIKDFNLKTIEGLFSGAGTSTDKKAKENALKNIGILPKDVLKGAAKVELQGWAKNDLLGTYVIGKINMMEGNSVLSSSKTLIFDIAGVAEDAFEDKYLQASDMTQDLINRIEATIGPLSPMAGKPGTAKIITEDTEVFITRMTQAQGGQVQIGIKHPVTGEYMTEVVPDNSTSIGVKLGSKFQQKRDLDFDVFKESIMQSESLGGASLVNGNAVGQYHHMFTDPTVRKYIRDNAIRLYGKDVTKEQYTRDFRLQDMVLQEMYEIDKKRIDFKYAKIQEEGGSISLSKNHAMALVHFLGVADAEKYIEALAIGDQTALNQMEADLQEKSRKAGVRNMTIKGYLQKYAINEAATLKRKYPR